MLTTRPASDCRENGAGIQLSGIARLEGSSPLSLRPSTRSSRPPALLPTASSSSQSPLLSLRLCFPSIRPRHGLPRRPRLLPRLRSPPLRDRDGERVPDAREREKEVRHPTKTNASRNTTSETRWSDGDCRRCRNKENLLADASVRKRRWVSRMRTHALS